VFFNEVKYKDKSEILFLIKARRYTKLKYSRVPQGDIVSGGLAAILAAFFGYLITEKFGLELIDSGDFYFLLMYIVLFVSSLPLWVKFEEIKLSTLIKPIKNLLRILAITKK
jgi:hypothetical protein